jgi:hypothetical protein
MYQARLCLLGCADMKKGNSIVGYIEYLRIHIDFVFSFFLAKLKLSFGFIIVW